METPGQTCLRLLAALETLAAEQNALVRSGQLEECLQSQERARTIIGRLAELLARPDVAARANEALGPRVRVLHANQTATLELLQSSLAANQRRRRLIAAALGRLDRMQASYGRPRSVRPAAMGAFEKSA